MSVADVDAEPSELDVAHPVGRQHAANGALDQTFRVLRTNLRRRLGVQTAGKTGVTVVDLLIPLVAAELDLLRVDHNDEVTGIDVRVQVGFLRPESVRAILTASVPRRSPAASTIYQSCVASAVVCW